VDTIEEASISFNANAILDKVLSIDTRVITLKIKSNGYDRVKRNIIIYWFATTPENCWTN
jgi:hypothetical protein